MDRALAETLTAALGSAAIAGSTVSPASAEEVTVACRTLSRSGARFSVVSSLHRGAETAADDGVSLSLHRLARVDVEAGNLVARAEAGAPLAALRAAVEAEGLRLAAVPAPGTPAATAIGALVARGRVPRRALTGIEAVLPDGESVRAGGAVLKDVAGFDLCAVLLGSLGRLALITSASFRLQPAASSTEAHEAAISAAGGPMSTVVRAAFDPGGLLVAR